MSLFNYINKAKNYIKTYGLIKGIKEIINKKNNKDKALKELNEFLPKVEETVKPVLSNYKDQSINQSRISLMIRKIFLSFGGTDLIQHRN